MVLTIVNNISRVGITKYNQGDQKCSIYLLNMLRLIYKSC